MVTILLAKRDRLISGALARLLEQEHDLEVVGQVWDPDEVTATAEACGPQLILLDGALPHANTLVESLYDRLATCRLLVMLQPGKTVLLEWALQRRTPRVGFISTDATPTTLLEGIRRMAGGEAFLDPPIALAAFALPSSPLTRREREVLQLAAHGESTINIARKLYLAHGTVRNYISHALAKTGGATKAEAIRIADEAGWL